MQARVLRGLAYGIGTDGNVQSIDEIRADNTVPDPVWRSAAWLRRSRLSTTALTQVCTPEASRRVPACRSTLLRRRSFEWIALALPGRHHATMTTLVITCKSAVIDDSYGARGRNARPATHVTRSSERSPVRLFAANGRQRTGLGVVRSLVGLGAIAVLFVQATPANAATVVSAALAPQPPNFYFYGSTPTTTMLDFYYNDTNTGNRVVYTWKAGSGQLTVSGANDECHSNVGWLPAGPYGRQDNDDNSQVVHYYKTDGNTTVRGNVWSLGNKYCTPISGGWSARFRTELFIHSNGIEGTQWNGSYATQGCIKLSQADRATLVGLLWKVYDADNERLFVTH
jgi:hypothetical protein